MTIAEQLQGGILCEVVYMATNYEGNDGEVVLTFKDNSTLLWADGEFWL